MSDQAIDPDRYLKDQLVAMARDYGVPTSGTKTQIAQRINETKQAIQALELVMTEYEIKDPTQLTDLNPDELERLISQIPIHNKTQKVKDVLTSIRGHDQRVKAFVVQMALKFCRCAEQIKSGSPYGICISRLFHPYGITVSKPRCHPAKLLAKRGEKKILFKKSK